MFAVTPPHSKREPPCRCNHYCGMLCPLCEGFFWLSSRCSLFSGAGALPARESFRTATRWSYFFEQ